MKDNKKIIKVEGKIPSLQSNLPPKILKVEDAFNQAVKLYNSGNLDAAEKLLNKILNAQPKNFNAMHLLGLACFSKGDFKTAIELIKKAIELQPNAIDFISNLCEVLRCAKQLNEAIAYGEKAIKISPNNASAISNLALAYYDNGDLEKAKGLQETAIKINPKIIAALNNLGSIYRDLKQKDKAIDYYKKVIDISPNHVEALNNLGAVLNELDKAEEALNILARAIKLNPKFAEAHYNIANSFFALENFEKAEIAYKKCIELKPNHAESIRGLAKVYKETNKLDEAQRLAETALELSPNSAEALCILADIYNANAFHQKSEEFYQKAIELKPDLYSAYLALGYLKTELGKLEEAEKLFNFVKEKDDDKIGASLALIQVKKVSANDDSFKTVLEEYNKNGSNSQRKAIPINFALGKAYDDIKDYDNAFKHYNEGCKLKRQTINYSPDNTNLIAENICNFFTKEKIDSLRDDGCKSEVPIFILGMPRSGTTLTEQIIASHPDVFGAGELPDLMRIAVMPRGKETEGYPFSLKDITKEELKEMGQKYVDGLRERNSSAKHITDKMPANFHYVGLIHLMLPNAKIIHVKRNAVDTCLSGYTKLFNKSQNHSYDLFEIGNYYRNYNILMNHWKKVLPENSFYEIRYEELVADNENQARKLIEYCGLEWNDACLDFHKTERSVKTASVTQVRQPIYNSSVERWRKYEKHLQPLLDILGDLAYKN